jgi:hypothetical protein
MAIVLECVCSYCSYKFEMPSEAARNRFNCPKCGFVVYSPPRPVKKSLVWPSSPPDTMPVAAEAPLPSPTGTAPSGDASYEDLGDHLLFIIDNPDAATNDLCPNLRQHRQEEWESAVCAAVCERTRLTPSEWKQLNTAEKRPYLIIAINKTAALDAEALAAPSTPTGKLPQDDSTATLAEDYTAYRPAREFINPERFPTLRAIRNALDSNPTIRTRRPISKSGKPIMNRLLIHAGDWHEFLNQPQAVNPLDLSATVVDAVMEAEHRKAEIRKQKDGGK